jgi:DNA-binding GntR family transcriptional regulator
MLHADSQTPLYMQLYRQIRTNIEQGSLQMGRQLPSERQLAAEYGISRPTARRALRMLREEGIISARRGRGSFVAPA